MRAKRFRGRVLKNSDFGRPLFEHLSGDYEKILIGMQAKPYAPEARPPSILSGPRSATSTTARFIMWGLCGNPSLWFYPSSAGGSKVRGIYYAGYYAGSIKSGEAIF